MTFYIEAYRFRPGQFYCYAHEPWALYTSRKELQESIENTKQFGGTTICYFRVKPKTNGDTGDKGKQASC